MFSVKIILSPSKTQNKLSIKPSYETPQLLDSAFTLEIFNRLSKLSKHQLSQLMHLKGEKADEAYDLYQHFDPLSSSQLPAIRCYQGLAFKQLEIEHYNEQQWTYFNEHVRILSAMYGLLHPQNLIWPYRLDFTMTLESLSLKNLWSTKITQGLLNEDLIFDLSSNEFGTLIKSLEHKIHHVVFLEMIHSKPKIISANAKKARGQLLNFMILNQVKEVSDIQDFTYDGYHYRKDLSDVNHSVFVKPKL